jgi:hypothetical protein
MSAMDTRQSNSQMAGATKKVARMFYMNSQRKNLRPNHSLNRIHCGMQLKARHFILGL